MQRAALKTFTLQDNRVLVYTTIVLIVLITFESLVGIFASDFYVNESIPWELQTGGQDVMNLLIIVPLLVVCVASIHFNKEVALLVWAGAMLYTFYTFSIYCFDVHFNRLFLVYCLTLCLSVFSLIYFLQGYLRREVSGIALSRFPFRSTGVYFVVISALFTVTWLLDIVPSLVHNTVPREVIGSRLPTNPVHVLDLSFILPLIFFTGILLLLRRPLGYRLAPVLSVFIVLMELTIALLTVILKTQGQQGSFMLAAVMTALAIISTLIFLNGLRALQYETHR